MEHPCCLVFINDEGLRSQLEEMFQAKEIDCYFIKQGDQLSQLVKNWNPFMMVIDLSSADSEWIFRHIAGVELTRPGFPIVALVSDAQETLRRRAESYGCRFIFTESEFLEKLPGTVDGILTKRL